MHLGKLCQPMYVKVGEQGVPESRAGSRSFRCVFRVLLDTFVNAEATPHRLSSLCRSLTLPLSLPPFCDVSLAGAVIARVVAERQPRQQSNPISPMSRVSPALTPKKHEFPRLVCLFSFRLLSLFLCSPSLALHPSLDARLRHSPTHHATPRCTTPHHTRARWRTWTRFSAACISISTGAACCPSCPRGSRISLSSPSRCACVWWGGVRGGTGLILAVIW